MNRLLALLLSAWVVFGSGAVLAQTPAPAAPSVPRAPAADSFAGQYASGNAVALEIAKATGVSLTPLLGLTVLGGFKYYTTPAEQRAALPWFQHPFFFFPGLGVILFLWFGHRIPGIRKFFQVFKDVEDKASAVLAIPVVGWGVASLLGPKVGQLMASSWHEVLPSAYAATGVASVVSGTWNTVGEVLVWFAGVAIGFMVWLVGHSINVLVILSPVAMIDWVLKGLKVAAIGILAAAAGISPMLGLVVSLVYLAIAIWLAGASFRWMVFGNAMGADILFRRWRKAPENPADVAAFAGRALGLPARTKGRVVKKGAGLCFRFRPWLVLPWRERPLPSGEVLVEQGFIATNLLLREPHADTTRMVAWLPPRYRGHAEAIAAGLGGLSVRNAPLLRGLMMAWRWIEAQFEESTPAGLEPAQP